MKKTGEWQQFLIEAEEEIKKNIAAGKTEPEWRTESERIIEWVSRKLREIRRASIKHNIADLIPKSKTS